MSALMKRGGFSWKLYNPAYPTLRAFRLVVLGERDGRYGLVMDSARSILREPGLNTGLARTMYSILVSLSLMQGNVSDADQVVMERFEYDIETADAETALFGPFFYVPFRFQITGDRAGTAAMLDEGLGRIEWNALDTLGRPYASLAYALAALGRPDDARVTLEEQLDYTPAGWLAESEEVESVRAMIAVAEGDFERAAHHFRTARSYFTIPRYREYELGSALLAAGYLQEAAAVLESATESTGVQAIQVDYGTSTLAFRALGRVYEELGRPDDAVRAYLGFLARCEEADPMLRSQLDEIRKRIDGLLAARAREPET